MDESIDNLNKTAVESVDNVVAHLSETPIVSVYEIALWTGYTNRGAYKVIDRLVLLGILVPYGDGIEYGQKWISKDYKVQLEAEASKTNPDTINIVSVGYDQTGDSILASTKLSDYSTSSFKRIAPGTNCTFCTSMVFKAPCKLTPS